MKKHTPWVGGAIVVTLIFCGMYGVVQQMQRNYANFPQLQLAQDAAAALNTGAQKLSVTQGKVEMTTSLASFVNVYNRDGAVVAGSGLVNGEVPIPPVGMLKAADNKDYSAVTYQPKAGVRIASVVVSSEKYYVMSGRSLKFVEQNETNSLNTVAAGEVLSLFVLAICYAISGRGKHVKPTKIAAAE